MLSNKTRVLIESRGGGMMDKSNFLFVYDFALMKYLDKNGVRYITKAIHPTTMKMFFLYFKTAGIQGILDQFKIVKSDL
jgi:hypothetical protein